MTKSFVKISYYIFGMAMIIAGMLVSVSEAGIALSKHDFSIFGMGGPTPFAGQFYIDDGGPGLPIEEICVFCHTPHAASTDAQTKTLLWNRAPSAATFIPYSSSTSTTVAPDTGDYKPTGISMMCMSCHDGVTSIAVNTLLNAPGAGNPGIIIEPTSGLTVGSINEVLSDGLGGWGANIGNTSPGGTEANLSNDHPISFEWNTSLPGYTLPPNGSPLRLFGPAKTRVECATCHSVHDPTNVPFLAMPNTNSDMCRTCHDK